MAATGGHRLHEHIHKAAHEHAEMLRRAHHVGHQPRAPREAGPIAELPPPDIAPANGQRPAGQSVGS